MSSGWEKSTREKLDGIVDSLKVASGEYVQISASGINAIKSHRAYNKSLKSLAAVVSVSRDIARKLAYQKIDIELAFSHQYIQHRLNLKEIGESLKYSGGGITFEVEQPIELLTDKKNASRCDHFGADQFGIRAIATLNNSGQLHKFTLHFALGLAVAEGDGRLYLAHDARLRNNKTFKNALVVASLEGVINNQLRAYLKDKSLLPIETEDIKKSGLQLSYLTAQVSTHTSIFAAITALPGLFSVPQHPPAQPLVKMDEQIHAILRITAFSVLEILKAKINKLAQDNHIYLQPMEGRIVPDPRDTNPDPTQIKKVLMVQWLAQCINEFGDQEDKGMQNIYAAIEKQPVQSGNNTVDRIDVNLNIIHYSGALIAPILDKFTTLIRPFPLLSIKNPENVDIKVEEDLVTVEVRYDLQV